MEPDQYKVGQCAPGVWKPDRPISPEEQKARDQLRDHINAGLRLIVGTKHVKRRPGDHLTGTFASYVEGGRLRTVWVTQPFKVVRVSNFAEWIANTPPWIPGPRPAAHLAAGLEFYEIVTD